MKIVLVPFGEIDDEVIPHLMSVLNTVFGVETVSREQMPLPPESHNKSREQYLASTLLATLKKQNILPDDKALGITGVDLYAPGLNFVFGQAEFRSMAAVVSLYRLHDEGSFLERTAKEAVHELGHTFGLDHCDDIHCVMHFSNTLHDTDIKQVNFCSNCRPQIFN